MAEDAEFLNLPPSWLERSGEKIVTLDAECWDAFEVFRFCSTQWRVEGGRRYGLDYAAVIPVAKEMGYKGFEILEEIRYLELGAIAAHNDQDIEGILDG